MTLGEKIRKYRMLNGMTQKELGMKVGFSKATADSRIRKYESNAMAPKDDMRHKIADALHIDIEAISDVKITSYTDAMYVFFELEESLGMSIEKKDGKTALVLDDDNGDIATLISYLNIWKNQKSALLPEGSDSTEEQKHEYDVWKSRFHSNVENYFSSKLRDLNVHYAPHVKECAMNHGHAKQTSEISLLLRKIIESGLTVSAETKFREQCFTFVVNELLHPVSASATRLFAQFLSEYDHFIELGADCSTEMQMLDRQLTVTYRIHVASFSIITSQTSMFLEFYKDRKNQTDYTVDDFELRYEADLAQYNNDIEDEIRMCIRQ